MDCDETFNYWEVVHFLLYGNGFQTWEYANEFALRTYAYLMPLVGLAKFVYLPSGLLPSLPLWFWKLLTEQDIVTKSSEGGGDGTILQEKVALFVLLRVTIGIWMAWAEISFGKAIYEQALVLLNNGSSSNSSTTSAITTATTGASKGNDASSSSLPFRLLACTSLVVEFLLLTSAGMAHAAGALLPSSTVMGLWLYAAAAFLRHQHVWFVILAIASTLAVGWPFGVFVFVPMGIAVLVRSFHQERLTYFLVQILAITALMQGTVMIIDYHHYGRLVSPILNILLYNTQNGKDELYGVEELSYYVKNLLLNFNYVAIVGLAGGVLPLLIWMRWWKDGWALVLPMYLWLAIVAPRPHKEERFLFPIYPCLCLGAAIGTVTTLDAVGRWMMRKNKQHMALSIRATLIVQVFVWGPAVVMSLSRTAALAKYYSAPLLVFSQLQTALQSSLNGSFSTTVVCTCGEWYRFPSHFYIPSKNPAGPGVVKFGFASSPFQGQLPQLFTSHGSGPLSTSRLMFNDENKPEEGSYTPLVDCDYLVDLQPPNSEINSCTETDGQNGPLWEPIARSPFLDADRTNALHRVLYIPHVHDKARNHGTVTFVDFTLYSKMTTPTTNAEVTLLDDTIA